MEIIDFSDQLPFEFFKLTLVTEFFVAFPVIQFLAPSTER